MTGGLHLLLIDDTPADRALALRALRRAFPEVSAVEIADAPVFDDALAVPDFDLVITDFQLNWSDGLSILRRVKAQRPECPVIIFTNSGNEEVAVEAMKDGADDYVVKAAGRETRLPLAVRGALDRAELRQREQDAQRQREAALGARDAFLSNAAHELRTPITTLLGFAELLQRRSTGWIGLTERDHQAFATLVRKAEELRTLADSLLDADRLQADATTTESAAVDLCAEIRAVLEDLGPMLDRHDLRVECAPGDAVARGSAVQVRRLIRQLLENAIKYSPRGGQILVAAWQRGAIVELIVRDQGIGIPVADLPRLFERYFRASNVTDDRISGFGLGLYLVRQVAERHGGGVRAESRQGEGSTFTVTLPALRTAQQDVLR